jgi:hypothetical protein
MARYCPILGIKKFKVACALSWWTVRFPVGKPPLEGWDKLTLLLSECFRCMQSSYCMGGPANYLGQDNMVFKVKL